MKYLLENYLLAIELAAGVSSVANHDNSNNKCLCHKDLAMKAFLQRCRVLCEDARYLSLKVQASRKLHHQEVARERKK